MITVTRMNDRDVVLNCDIIEMIEEAPDTTITMTTGRKVIVRDTVQEVWQKIFDYKKSINRA